MSIPIYDSPTGNGLSAQRMAQRTRTDIARGTKPKTESDPAFDHDVTLLVTELEAIEARRAAIEWLLEADLLRLCLV
jgi:hypothetical protein